MLFKTALRNLKRNPLMNILSLLQLIAVLLIAGIMVSSLCIRYRTYSPFVDILGSSGYYTVFSVGANRGYGTGERYFINGSDELAEELDAASVLSTYYVIKFSGGVSEGMPEPNILSYDDEVIKRYQPRLKEGRWLSADSDEIEAVISDSYSGWNVGDVVQLTLAAGNAVTMNELTVDVRIIGILDEGAEVFGLNRPFGEENNTYRIMYRPFYPERESDPVMLLSYSALNSFDPSIVQTISNSLITYYEAGFDNEWAREHINQADAGYLVSLKDMNENSRAYLQEQLLQLLPIVIVLLILVLVSSVSISALSARRRLKDYAKYYVVGLQWNQCVLVNLFQSLVTAAAAVIVTVTALLIVQYTALSETFMILWNGWLLLALVGIILLYLLFSMIMPILMLRSVSPKQLLTAE